MDNFKETVESKMRDAVEKQIQGEIESSRQNIRQRKRI